MFLILYTKPDTFWSVFQVMAVIKEKNVLACNSKKYDSLRTITGSKSTKKTLEFKYVTSLVW